MNNDVFEIRAGEGAPIVIELPRNELIEQLEKCEMFIHKETGKEVQITPWEDGESMALSITCDSFNTLLTARFVYLTAHYVYKDSEASAHWEFEYFPNKAPHWKDLERCVRKHGDDFSLLCKFYKISCVERAAKRSDR